jgi:quercetin dioxygenase-like cupin family protein
MSERHITSFPGFIAELPLADIPIAGIGARLLQADGRQVLFMEFQEDVVVPEHSHEAQWGVVLEGEMELTMDNKNLSLKKGDTYYIPKGVAHTSRIKRGYKDVVVFDQPDRYRSKG